MEIEINGTIHRVCECLLACAAPSLRNWELPSTVRPTTITAATEAVAAAAAEAEATTTTTRTS